MEKSDYRKREKFLRVVLQGLEYFVFAHQGSKNQFSQGPDPGKEFVAKDCEMGVAVDSLSQCASSATWVASPAATASQMAADPVGRR